MGSSFGDRLKQERLSRNLTQAELGGELYSASYISLLENAHREPTTEIIKQLAEQLAIGPFLCCGLGAAQSSTRGKRMPPPLPVARQSWDTRDYAGAASERESSSRLACANDDVRDVVEHDLPCG